MADTIFITGATGTIGAKLAAHLLETDRDVELILLVRGSSPEKAQERLEDALRITSPLSLSRIRQVTVVCGDITLERFGLADREYDDLAARVTHIIHSAASTKFILPLDEARAVNVSGTATVMAFARRARRLGSLKGVAYISTVFVCGNSDGEFREDDHGDGANFSNSYEQSKWEAERYVRSLMNELPITIFRPSIVVGDSRTGRTLLFNVLYTPLRYIVAGMIKALPCSPTARLDVVPVDYVVKAIRHIFLNGQSAGNTYHLVANRQASCTVGEIVSNSLNYVKRTTNSEETPAIKYLSRNEYESHFAGENGRERRMREMLRVFEPYIDSRITFTDTNTAAALAGTGISPERLTNYLDILLDYCYSSDWGRRFRKAA